MPSHLVVVTERRRRRDQPLIMWTKSRFIMENKDDAVYMMPKVFAGSWIFFIFLHSTFSLLHLFPGWHPKSETNRQIARTAPLPLLVQDVVQHLWVQDLWRQHQVSPSQHRCILKRVMAHLRPHRIQLRVPLQQRQAHNSLHYKPLSTKFSLLSSLFSSPFSSPSPLLNLVQFSQYKVR